MTPPTQFARPGEPQGQGATASTAGVAAVLGGLAVGAGIKLANNLGKKDEAPGSDSHNAK